MPSLLWVGCLKTLDESKLDDDTDSGTGATGGAGGSGGSSGNGGSGGSGGSSGDAQADGPVDAGKDASFTDETAQHPVSNLASGPATQIIASDDTHVFRTTYDQTGQPSSLSSHPLAGGSGNQVVPTLPRPRAMAAPVGTLFVYIAAGNNTTDDGSILRVPKLGGTADNIGTPAAIEHAVGIYASADGFAYVSAKAITPGKIALLRFSLSGGVQNADALYTSTSGNESGGDIVAVSSCVYWISNGGVWSVSTAGGERTAALSTQISDAIGITADAANFYFTRANGEVWQRQLSPAGCAGASSAEKRIASGFLGIGDVITYDGTVAWTATGDVDDAYAGGGIFTTSVGGIDIVQIGPSTNGPSDIEQSDTHVVYATTQGTIHKLPKLPVGDI